MFWLKSSDFIMLHRNLRIKLRKKGYFRDLREIVKLVKYLRLPEKSNICVAVIKVTDWVPT